MSRHRAPLERKVVWASAASIPAPIVAAFAVYLVDAKWFNGDQPPAVPMAIAAFIGVIVNVVLVSLAGYQAPHTFRTDPAAMPPGTVVRPSWPVHDPTDGGYTTLELAIGVVVLLILVWVLLHWFA